MIFEGKVRRAIAEGPIMPAGDQLGIKIGEIVKQFRTFDQLFLPFEGKLVRISIEELSTHCSQCGRLFSDPACGPTHALITSEREQDARATEGENIPR